MMHKETPSKIPLANLEDGKQLVCSPTQDIYYVMDAKGAAFAVGDLGVVRGKGIAG